MQTLETFPVITVSNECYDTIQSVGVGSKQAQSDIDVVFRGEKSVEILRAECLDGAAEALVADWNEYVDAIELAVNELNAV